MIPLILAVIIGTGWLPEHPRPGFTWDGKVIITVIEPEDQALAYRPPTYLPPAVKEVGEQWPHTGVCNSVIIERKKDPGR